MKQLWHDYMNKWTREATREIWKPFDKDSSLEWILIGFGFFMLVVILCIEVVNLWAN